MSGTAAPGDARAVSRPGRLSRALPWLGVAPFVLFAALFLLMPTLRLIIGSFQDILGNFTLANYEDFNTKIVISAYTTSIEISIVTAVGGGDLRVPHGLRRDRRRAAPVPSDRR